jgi:putative phage-type endonuclease
MTPTERTTWLAARRNVVGSSDSPAVCRMSPYAGPLDVYLNKLGLLPERENEAMRWGTRLEGVVAEAFSEETGIEVQDGPGLVTHPELRWLGATPDRLTLHGIPLELKTSRISEQWGAVGTDEVPEAYNVQVQHQMAVLGAEACYVAVLIAGSDFRWYRVPRSQGAIDALVAILGAFWQRVERREPPDLDWTDPRTPELVQYLRQPVAGSSVSLDDAALALVREYQELGGLTGEHEKRRQMLKGRLVDLMGAAELALLPDGRRIKRKQTTRKSYTVPECSYTDFRISGKTNGENP